MKTTTVTVDDLNAIDKLNGSASISTKSFIIRDNEVLKGALGQGAKTFSQYEEIQFINSQKRQIVEFQLSIIDYANLPKGIDKFRLEEKLIKNGSAAILKIVDEFYVYNYTAETTNIYDEPATIIINEPKAKVVNGKSFTIGDNATIIRNNLERTSVLSEVTMYLRKMEKILYLIEKNMLNSMPKGLLNINKLEMTGDEEDDMTTIEGIEDAFNSQKTFFVIKGKDPISNSDIIDTQDEIFIPIELEDKTDALIKNYSFFKEQVKETINANMNLLNGKRERLITGEIENQQDFSDSGRQHFIEIRKIDIAKMNELFGTNTEVIDVLMQQQEQAMGDSEDGDK